MSNFFSTGLTGISRKKISKNCSMYFFFLTLLIFKILMKSKTMKKIILNFFDAFKRNIIFFYVNNIEKI